MTGKEQRAGAEPEPATRPATRASPPKHDPDPDHPDAPDRQGNPLPTASEDRRGAEPPSEATAAAPEPVTAAEPLVEALCQGAERLLKLAGPRARRVRLRSGKAAVLVEWHAAATSERPAERAGPPSEGPPGDGAEGSPAADAGRSDRSADAPSLGEGAHLVRAPCVGTFYHAPQPGAAPFVEPGDTVAAGDQVGLVEAMKLMTPVETDTPGRVVRVLVADGTAVEFGQPLLALEPTPSEG